MALSVQSLPFYKSVSLFIPSKMDTNAVFYSPATWVMVSASTAYIIYR